MEEIENHRIIGNHRIIDGNQELVFYKGISLEVIRDENLKFLAHKNITFEQKVLLDNIWFTKC
jgi:hypothetical protein